MTDSTSTGESIQPFQCVLLIHGIRDQGDWQAMVRDVIAVEGQIDVIPVKYGYFDALRFWFPFWTRRKPIKRVEAQIRAAIQKYRRIDPHAKFSVIAHSFGTYIIGTILKENFDLKLHCLIMCGAVLPADFQWEQIQGRFDDDNALNECGKSDIWPILAQSTTWGYGSSGTHGFGSVLVKDRVHSGGHDQYFTRKFVEKFWEPFIRRREFRPTEFELHAPPTPWWLSILGLIPLRWLIIVILMALLTTTSLFVVSQFKLTDVPVPNGSSDDPKQPEFRIVITREALISVANQLEESASTLTSQNQEELKESAKNLKSEAAALVTPIKVDASSSAPWLAIAVAELGQAEISGDSHNPRILEYIRSTGQGLENKGDELPWVSYFVNWVFAQAGIDGTNNGMARSWSKWGVELVEPKPGAVAVFKRPPSEWGGVVGFFLYESETHVICIMGNHANSVSINALPNSNLLGYRWPSADQGAAPKP